MEEIRSTQEGLGYSSNLALNKTTTTSSIEGTGYEGSKAVDGGGTTRWASLGSDPQWIYVDLGATYSISQVKLTWETASATSYQIQVSNDASTWTNIYTTTNGDGATDNLTGLSGAGRYIRMYGTIRNTVYGYSLWEFEVYGSAVDVTAPSVPTGLASASITQTSFTLNWTASTDNVGVTGYDVFKDGVYYVGSTSNSLNISGLTCGTSYNFTVEAFDNPAPPHNISAQSRPLNVSTSTCPIPNIALNKNVFVSSELSTTYPKANAVDGTTSTHWRTTNTDANPWVYIDLGAQYNVNNITLRWATNYGSGYVLKISTDASTYSNLAILTGQNGGVDAHTVSGTGRYIGIEVTGKSNASQGIHLQEVEDYGTSSGGGRRFITRDISPMPKDDSELNVKTTYH